MLNEITSHTFKGVTIINKGFGMDKQIYRTLPAACDSLSVLGLDLIHKGIYVPGNTLAHITLLVLVTTLWLIAKSHYLNQCRLFIHKVLLHLNDGNFNATICLKSLLHFSKINDLVGNSVVLTAQLLNIYIIPYDYRKTYSWHHCFMT